MWGLDFGGSDLCVQRLACRAISASTELLFRQTKTGFDSYLTKSVNVAIALSVCASNQLVYVMQRARAGMTL